VPDVAYNAAVLHGVLTYLDIPGIPAGFYRFGGTSAGAPQWAAITAIANDKAGARLGFLNSSIYRIGAARRAYAASFHDIISGTNSAVEFDVNGNPLTIAGFNASTGWDATTGTGSPVGTGLVNNLILYVQSSDGEGESSTTAPIAHSTPTVRGQMQAH
jgi:subtilase family serine protease